jgi:hypothetical protein
MGNAHVPTPFGPWQPSAGAWVGGGEHCAGVFIQYDNASQTGTGSLRLEPSALLSFAG